MLKKTLGTSGHVCHSPTPPLTLGSSLPAAVFLSRCLKKVAFGLALILFLALASPVFASTVLLNFDSVDTSASPHRVDATAYFASYGITVSGVAPASVSPDIILDSAVYDVCAPGNGCVVAASPSNVLELCCFVDTQSSTGSFTLHFSQAVSNVSFVRPEIVPGASGIITPAWTATAYDSSGNVLGSVGEGFDSTYSAIPAVTFSLLDSGIASLTIASNNGGFAALSNIPIDNLQFNTAPEPESAASVGLGILALSFWALRVRSRRLRSPD